MRRFADDRNIGSFDDLERHGYVPTPKQRINVMKRVSRTADPLPFAQAWTDNFVSNKYGQATTHWDKLQARVERGVGNPCPLLLIGLPAAMIRFDCGVVDTLDDAEPIP